MSEIPAPSPASKPVQQPEPEKRGSGSAIARVLVGVLIAVLLLFAALAFFITRQLNHVIQPFQDVNAGLSTQVSQLLHPTPTIIPDPVSIIREVQALARLETIQYSVEKIITAETNQGFWGNLVGDRLLFVAHGYVIAGVDLGKLGEDDLEMRGSSLLVTLPEPEIFVATIDNEKSYVYDRDTGILTRPKRELETLARQAAEQEIRRTAIEDEILVQARRNAEAYLVSLLNGLGYTQVIFE